MSSGVRGRFAPSPTGDLHLGTARTALVAWLEARAAGGAFFLRIEDLDTARVVPGAAERQLEDLRWLGLDWDGEPVVQSRRLDRYRAALARLERAGRIYRCFCSRAEIARAASAPHAGEEGPRYPGTCRDLSAAEIAERAARRAPAWRFRVDDPPVEFEDLLYGRVVQDVGEAVGDFVVCRADGTPAYQLAVVVDDAEMAITDVVRGDDLLASTPRQLTLFRALGLPPPRYLHVPLVLDAEGVRLAKRHRSATLRALRDAGASPESVVGQLGATLNLCPAGAHVSPVDLLAVFDVGRLPRTGTVLSSRGPGDPGGES